MMLGLAVEAWVVIIPGIFFAAGLVIDYLLTEEPWHGGWGVFLAVVATVFFYLTIIFKILM